MRTRFFARPSRRGGHSSGSPAGTIRNRARRAAPSGAEPPATAMGNLVIARVSLRRDESARPAR
jgi:hypothetical protein